MKARERDQIHSQLAEVWVQLAREPQAASHPTHSRRDQVVQVTNCTPKIEESFNINFPHFHTNYPKNNLVLTARSAELESPETNIIKSFIVQNHAFVSILYQLVHREGGIIWLHNCVRDLWRWEDGESEHHSIWVFLSHLWYQEGPHARTSASSKWMAHLKTWPTQKSNTLSASAKLEWFLPHFYQPISLYSTYGKIHPQLNKYQFLPGEGKKLLNASHDLVVNQCLLLAQQGQTIIEPKLDFRFLMSSIFWIIELKLSHLKCNHCP